MTTSVTSTKRRAAVLRCVFGNCTSTSVTNFWRIFSCSMSSFLVSIRSFDSIAFLFVSSALQLEMKSAITFRGFKLPINYIQPAIPYESRLSTLVP